jgi:twitching motility protein PilT
MSVEQILKSAKAINAEQVFLEAGKTALMVVNGVTRELTKTQLTPYDIFKLIAPIMPEDKKVALVGQPTTEFVYRLDGVGEYHILVLKETNGIKVIFKDRAFKANRTDSEDMTSALSSTQAFAGKAPTAQPIMAQPVMAQPVMAQPVMAQPVMAQPTPTGQPLPPPMGQPVPPQQLMTPMGQAINSQGAMPPGFAQPIPATQQLPQTVALPPRGMPVGQPVQALPAQPVPPTMGQSSIPMGQPDTVPLPMANQALPMGQPSLRPPSPPQATPVGQIHPTANFSSQDEGTAILDEQQKALLLGKPPEPRQPLTPLPKPQAFGNVANVSIPSPVNPLPPPPAQNAASLFSTTGSGMGSTTGAGINTFARTMGGSDRQRFRQEVDKLLERTLKMRGSDLHLATGAPPIVRRFGSLIRLEGDQIELEKAKFLVREILTDEQHRHFEKTGDLDFSYEAIGIGRFRGNVLRQNRGVDLTFHVVPSEIMAPEALGLPSLVRDLTTFHQGLILITGAAGQGKSTTISSLVDVINNQRAMHIITVEDPIEFVHPIDRKSIVNQREVGRHTKSFANALRAALREDPDVIVVGEMRDLETISLAITASETGHLVMGTLMTSSAHQTVDRILESFPASQQNQIRAMLSDSLRAVISQRLLPLADESGMALAAEIMLGTTAISNLIREKKTFQIPSVIQTSRHLGMKRMDDALLDLVQTGKVLPQKALDFAFDKKGFDQATKRFQG